MNPTIYTKKHAKTFMKRLLNTVCALKTPWHCLFRGSAVTEADIATYKAELKWYIALRLIAKQDAQETVDFSKYESQIRKLVDRYVVGESVQGSDGLFLVNELGQSYADKPENWSEEKTRNETDLIKSRLKRTIEQDLAIDPFAQIFFSDLLRKAIAEAAALFDHPHQQYALFKEFEDKVKRQEVDGIPAELQTKPHARAYYGILELIQPNIDGTAEAYVKTAIQIEATVQQAVAENSLNPQNIEAAIRKTLLPSLFNLLGCTLQKTLLIGSLRLLVWAYLEEHSNGTRFIKVWHRSY